jgi:hypothetical protein
MRGGFDSEAELADSEGGNGSCGNHGNYDLKMGMFAGCWFLDVGHTGIRSGAPGFETAKENV